jgi:hypothetical protein
MARLKHVGCTLAFLWLSVAPAQAQIEQSKYFSKDFQLRAVAAVARISIEYKDLRVYGCGVCIGDDGKHTYILSCAHVIEGADKSASTKVEFFSEKSYPNPCLSHTKGFTFWLDRDNDLALLKVAVTGGPVVKICPHDADLNFNIPVLAVGCGAGAPPVAQVGKFVGQDNLDDFLINRGAVGGRSGGAAISAHGLIGIIARTSDDKTHAVNHWKIHRFLKDIGYAGLVKKPAATAVAGTTWTGKENLQGFGKLTFEFHADGTAVMTDAQGTVKGTWAQKGQKVVIRFSDCVYVGEIKGQQMSGAAQFVENDQLTGKPWTFAVTRQ